ncbi:MAG: GlcG/HbpS family heme-binding protein [Pseudohaliea sp.]
MDSITTTRAEEIIRRACDRAADIGVAACIAVVDAGAHLKAFSRMDGAFAGAVDVSQRKARTAALFPLPTGDFGQLVAGQQLTGMELTNGGLAAFHGGLPVMEEGRLLGAIGVSGGSAEQDLAIATHALATQGAD